MDIDFSPEDRTFQREVRAWFETHTPPELQRKTVTGEMLQKDEIARWQRQLDAQGWLVAGWPQAHGGPGWTPTQRYIFDLERAAAKAPIGLSMGVIMLGPVLIAFGSPEQQARYLPRIRRCEDWWCQGYSEPGAGFDLASLKTTAVADGDDYVINGSKIWITSAHWATHMFCQVSTASTGKKQEGISFLLIEMDRPGIEVRPIVSIDGEHHLNQVFLTDVRVPKTNLVGREGQGWDIAKYLLTHERTSIAGITETRIAGRGSPWAIPLLWMLPQPMLMEMVLTGDLYPIETFKQLGFINYLEDTPDAVRARATALAERIRDNAPLSVMAGKESIMTAMSAGCEAGMALARNIYRAAYASEDAQEGPRAFAEKRKPVWKGR